MIIPSEIQAHEASVHSSGGEDGVIEYVFGIIGTENKVAVEIGALGQKGDNTLALRAHGWRLVLFGLVEAPDVIMQPVTTENVNGLLASEEVPEDLDLLSIDVDGADYWIWQAIEIRPRVVIIEYNPNVRTQSVVVPYRPEFVPHKTCGTYYGASAQALIRLAAVKGYALAWGNLYNLMFLRDDVAAVGSIEVREFVARQENRHRPSWFGRADHMHGGWTEV